MDTGSKTARELPNLKTFSAPPKGFDLTTGSEKQLALYGIPRRPDPTIEPGLRKLWDSISRNQ
jgi:hypothetical protein